MHPYPFVRGGSTAHPNEIPGALIALVTLNVFFITLNPFSSLDTPSVLGDSTGGEGLTYISIFILALAGLFLVAQRERISYVLAGTSPVLIFFGWLLFTIPYSSDPATSAKRSTLSLATYLLAAMLPWLTKGMHQFANFLLISAVTVLAISYLGILLLPNLTIHQASDLDASLAGDWRGVYEHKNVAAIMMGVYFYAGWFAARNGMLLLGLITSLAALIFLLLSGGKSALGFVLVASGLAYMIAGSRSFWRRAIIALGPLALIGFLTIGSVMSDSARSILSLLPVDPTFTGRSDTWKFAVAAVKESYLMGHGFEAFWHSAAVESSSEGVGWERLAHTSHNGYLDMALTIGLPGLGLLIFAFVVTPLRDFQRTLHTPENEKLAYFFLNVWLFLLYQNMFEAFFVSRADPMWFALALATCGLRYTARYNVRT